MSKKPYKGARFINNTHIIPKPKVKCLTSRLIAKRVIATIASSLLAATFLYDAYMYRDIEVNLTRQIIIASELSNPCASVEALDNVVQILKDKKMDKGNATLIPDSPLYPSEPIDQDLGVYVAQINNSKAVYNLMCDDMALFEPKVRNITSNTEEAKEQAFANLISKNKKLAKYVQTADFSTTQQLTDSKLLDPATKKASIPDDIHLMPYLRLIISTRYVCFLILFVLYFFDFIQVLQKLQLTKLTMFILNKIAPWNIK